MVRMTWTSLLIVNVAAFGLQDAPPSHAPAPDRTQPAAESGLWPTPRLIELMVTRWAEAAAAEYELDEGQRTKVRAATLGRWSDFAAEHQAELQPLLNEFLEMRLGLEPPEGERVQNWAQKALPLFEEMRDELHKTTDDFRAVMRPEQRAKLEIEVFKRRTGLQYAENKLRHWSQGNIDPEELWQPLRETRRERRERREARRAAAEQAQVEGGAERNGARPQREQPADPPDQIAVELDLWGQYAQAFIEHYELDDAQRTTVLSCLRELQERATAHREAHRPEIDKLEILIAKPDKTAEEQIAMRRQLVQQYGPIDAMFQELKMRLEAVLTSQQQAGPEFTFSGEPAAEPESGSPAPSSEVTPLATPPVQSVDAPKTKRRPSD